MILNLTEMTAEPIHSQISRQVRARVLAGTVESGGLLPPPRGFARQNRVSVISVLRAFDDLVAEGWLLKKGESYEAAPVSEERRRDLAQQRLLETLREQEFSLKELELARDIQCRLLPPPKVSGKQWTMVAHNEPARFVAGDFYDVLRHTEGMRSDRIDLVVADVAGKGIGPSLIMASVKAVLPFITADRSVTEVMAELNSRLRSELARREFVALALARFEPATGRLEIANAGLPDPYRMRAEDGLTVQVEALEVPGERLPLGMRAAVEYQSIELTLEVDDRLMLFSDGLPEADLPSGDPIGYERFEKLLEGSRFDRDPEVWLEGLLGDLREQTSAQQRDDWTAVVLERSLGEKC